jgi:hypothetical protein
MRQAARSASLVLPLLLLAACSSGDGADAGDGPAAGTSSPAAPSTGDGGIQRAENDLVIEVDRGDGSPPEEYTLTCVGSAEGSVPEPEAACQQLDGMTEPFAPLPGDIVCAEVYGGPQTARITGLWRGEPVDLQLSRTNACHTAQWDRLAPLLPVPVGDVPLK